MVLSKNVIKKKTLKVQGYKIRNYHPDDLKDVCLLIARTFKRFNSKEGTKQGVNDFVGFYRYFKKHEKEIINVFKKDKFHYVAIGSDGDIIGVVRGRINRIANLFVDGDFHGNGIGKALVKRFEKDVKKCGSNEINIRASLHGVPFYKKMGYHDVSYSTTMKGIIVQPMLKKL